MKRKSVIIISILTIFLVIFEIYHVYEINYNNKQVIYSQKQVLKKDNNVLSIMYETSANSNNYKSYKGDYFPTNQYIFNEEASKCENGGKVTYNEKTNKIEVKSNISDKCYAYFDVIVMTAKDAILYTNPIIKFGIDYSAPATDFNESGLFTANDNDGVSYFYRGNVDNNYVNFGNYLWQIIRVNGNGTIRMMIMEDLSEDHSCSSGAAGSGVYLLGRIPASDQNCSSGGIGFTTYNEMGMGWCFDHDRSGKYTLYNDAYVALMSWYEQWTGNGTNQAIVKHIADEPFCNDISMNTLPNGSTSYSSAYIRLSLLKEPTLTCNSNNEYTVKEDYMQYPVGLITADEVVMAGGVVGKNNSTFYLNRGVDYYTLTYLGTFSSHIDAPYSPDQDYYALSKNGVLTSYTGLRNIFPVINLNADTVFEGAGTRENPFKIYNK